MSNLKLLTKDSLDLYLADGYKVDAGQITRVYDIDPIDAVATIIDMVDQGSVCATVYIKMGTRFVLLCLKNP